MKSEGGSTLAPTGDRFRLFNLLFQKYLSKYLSNVDECQVNPVNPKIIEIE